MIRRSLWGLAPCAVLLLAGVAQADTVTYPDGKTAKMSPNQEVSGPATIKSDDGKDTITLRKGATVQFLGTEVDEKTKAKTELYFLKSGAADASVGFGTRLATPAFWAFPASSSERATFYAETFGVNRGYARATKDSGMVRLIVDAETETEAQMGKNQGISIEGGSTAGGGRTIEFTTDPHNDFKSGRARVLYPLATGLLIDLAVPKATKGSIKPSPDQVGKTLVENAIQSWKAGKILIRTSLRGSQTAQGEIGPGVVAVIDNASGKIEIGFVKVDFATLKAAVSLTSEFESLATSPLTK